MLNISAVAATFVVILAPPERFTAKSPPTVAPPLVVSVEPISPADELMLPLAVMFVVVIAPLAVNLPVQLIRSF